MRYTKKGELYSSLEAYSKTKAYPFHMPGHKRNSGLLGSALPYDIDITEISGFDDLHSAKGILKNVQEKAQRLYRSERSYILVNGSTCGILAAISSVVHRGDCVIAARNCHKAVYNACFLSELDVRFIFPDTNELGICASITPQSVFRALEDCPNAKAVILTSPTYEGVISDIKAIADICHAHGAPLIVDSAHGAHLPFFSFGKPGEPVTNGADIVISSLHKTLPSLTQTAVAHVNGGLVDHERFEKYLGFFETSSPSYVLMASIDACFDFLSGSEEMFSQYENRLRAFYDSVKALEKLNVLRGDAHGWYAFDKGKLVISTGGTSITGVQLMERLRLEYGLELEMAYPMYALAMTSVCDTDEGLSRLSKALCEIDKTLKRTSGSTFPPKLPRPIRLCMTNAELDALPKTKLTRELAEGGGFVSRSCIFAYPPGIPIVTPGEIVSTEEFEYIEALKRCGVRVEAI